MERARKLIFRLQVNIDKINSRRYDVTWYVVYRGPSKDLRNLHINGLYIFCEVKFNFKCLELN